MNQKALIIGGDKRQMYIKKYIESKFGEVFHLYSPADIWVLDETEKYSHIILPVPFSKDRETVYTDGGACIRVDEVISRVSSCHTVFGSGFGSDTLDKLEDKGVEYHDFMRDKILKRANAYLTAQGVLRLMLDDTQDCITGKKALIIGFGDVGDTLAEKLRALGLEVYITARNRHKLSLAEYSGYKTMTLPASRSSVYLFDYIFGTVPVNLLGADDIRLMKNDSTYIELASPPYTAEASAFEVYNKKYILGASLPGRFLPMASGRLLAEYISAELQRG